MRDRRGSAGARARLLFMRRRVAIEQLRPALLEPCRSRNQKQSEAGCYRTDHSRGPLTTRRQAFHRDCRGDEGHRAQVHRSEDD